MGLFKSDSHYVICNGQVFHSGTEIGCRRYAKQRKTEFPNHQTMELLKLIEEVE